MNSWYCNPQRRSDNSRNPRGVGKAEVWRSVWIRMGYSERHWVPYRPTSTVGSATSSSSTSRSNVQVAADADGAVVATSLPRPAGARRSPALSRSVVDRHVPLHGRGCRQHQSCANVDRWGRIGSWQRPEMQWSAWLSGGMPLRQETLPSTIHRRQRQRVVSNQ